MYQVICTHTNGSIDSTDAKVLDYADRDDAIMCFNEKVKGILDDVVTNDLLKIKMSMHNFKAAIQIESTYHVVALVKDGGILDI